MKKQDFNNQWTVRKAEEVNAQIIDLPHDAMIVEKREQSCASGSGGAYFPGGVYYYEKTFEVPEEWREQYILFEFEGVYQNAKVYINGKEAGGCPYGYIPFTVSAAPFLNYGEKNTIRVAADNSKHPNSRWYTGSGIYRPVWLYVADKQHIEHEGVKITTLSYRNPRIRVETAHTGKEVCVETLYGGKVIAHGSGDDIELDIPNAKLWSDEAPNLYECRVTLKDNGTVVDEVIEEFGIRMVEWSPKGLFINGKETLLRGGCVHHDNGILGARSYRESEERRIRIMKKAGYNAIRISHNPASKAMLHACDTYGMYVMDETWDMWYSKKTKYDYSHHFEKHYLADIKAMVDKDFNHPSVIMYSIGNEVTEPVEEKGLKLIREMTEYIHKLDTNRAVTCGLNLWLLYTTSKGKGVYKSDQESEQGKEKKADQEMNSTVFNLVASQVGTKINNGAKSKKADEIVSPCLDVLDIAGYNYSSGRYPLDGKLHPNRVIVGSETYPQDIYKNWEMVKKYPYLIGDFVWTCWDYLGEVGLGAWAYSDDGARFNKPYPWLLADTGTIDILGNIGAQADYAAVVWGLHDNPLIHVRPVNHSGEKPKKMVWRGTDAMPSWSWKDCEGKKALIEIYSDSAYVKLVLNDKLIGLKKVKQCKAIFKTKYKAGTLTAIAYDMEKKEIGRTTLISAKGKNAIQIKPEKMNVNQNKVFYVNINIAGENGIVESNDDRKLKVEVDGGELLAFGSANPRTEEQYHTGSFTTYYGRAQAIVRSKAAGNCKITVSGEKTETFSVNIQVEP
ncbi:glycoside hydrolase family 2 protein [Konateibacter massiliensis]|uniref:glycoside hydrolase family 2 protein n=1 Tax=Konateibacter massiliensis TaxID=2002841 RepID=UPI000C148403|nr:glycoside hydrolase family 2 TIM barrel-domain containing protein [Konateibacter massiliensis]